MKTLSSLLIILILIAGVTVPAWGDIFTTTTAVSFTQFKIEGATAPFNYVVSGNLVSVSLCAEADLGVRPGIGIRYGRFNGYNITTIYPRVDWGFQILDYTFKISEGYQVYDFTINSPGSVSYSYVGFTLGITGQWKISEMLTISGGVMIPQTGSFYRDYRTISVGNPAVRGYHYGLRITVLPLISFTVNSAYTGIGNDSSPFHIINQGSSYGVILRW